MHDEQTSAGKSLEPKSLGIKLLNAYRMALGHKDGAHTMYTNLPASDQEFWDRAALAFVASLSDGVKGELVRWTMDYDGSSMPDGAEPMPGLTCRHLREAAAALSATNSEAAQHYVAGLEAGRMEGAIIKAELETAESEAAALRVRVEEWEQVAAVEAAERRRVQARLAQAEQVIGEIAKAKPERVADGFVQGPLALWNWAQRLARDFLAAQHGEGTGGREP